MVIRPIIFSDFPNLVAAQSTRLGGKSIPPYESMNLGSNTQDNLEIIEQNKLIFTQELGFSPLQVVRAKQVHGVEILIADNAGYFDGYDAIITNKKNLLLAVSTADCVPILLYDFKTHAIAAIHAGWKGSCNMLTTKTMEQLSKTYDSNSEDIYAFIGPCIDKCSFEVNSDVANEFENAYVEYNDNKNKYFVDLKKQNADQLIKLGVNKNNIEISEFDTFERTDLFFSHRASKGVTGRMWTAIGMKN